MRSLLRPTTPPRVALRLLLVAAIPFGVAGYVHAHLVHQGFCETGGVGVLFVLNAIGTGVALALFALGRVRRRSAPRALGSRHSPWWSSA